MKTCFPWRCIVKDSAILKVLIAYAQVSSR